MQTVMTNGGDAPLADLLSGQTLWPSAGYFFGVPGLGDLQEGKSTGARPTAPLRTTKTGASRSMRRT